MYRRALLLTAATMALLSGPAFAADSTSDITTKITTNLKTSTAGAGSTQSDILIESNGSVVVTSVTPNITIDTSNIVTNKGSISNTGTTGAVGVQLNATGISAAFDNIGTMDLTGSGQNKVGIEITDPNGTGGILTGVPLPGATLPITTNTVIDLDAGSTLNITGDGSTGILVNSTAVVNGDILIGGAITLNPSTVTATSGGNVTGVNILGTMTGNFTVQTTGSISVFGEAGHGVVLDTGLNGSFVNLGTIQALGTTTPSTTTANPEAGSAVIIENSITGGIFNGGPSGTATTIGRASIAESGNEPALDIVAGATTTANIVIGAVPMSIEGGTASGYSVINRGSIAATTLNADLNSTAVEFDGTSQYGVTLQGTGVFNSGTISAAGTTDTKELSAVTVEGVVFGGFSTATKLNNTNEATAGVISASITGTNTAIATGIDIQVNASLTEIDNSGSITASASTTDNTITGLSSFAIRDETDGGTLTTVVNSGTISALTSNLANGLQIASAIDLVNSSQNFTLTNSGTISGAIELGTGNDTINAAGASSGAAVIVGNIDFGGGTDTLVVGTDGSHTANITGAIQELTTDGSVDITINASSTLTLKNDGIDTNNGINLTANTPVTNLHVNSGGTLNLTLAQAFNVDAPEVFQGALVTTIPDAGVINLATNSKLGVTFGTFVGATNTSSSSQFVLLDARAGNLIIADEGTINGDIAGPGKVPFLFTGKVCTFNVANSADPCTGTEEYRPGDSELVLSITPKSAATLGLTGFAAKMFPLANIALATDNPLGAAVISGVTSATQAQSVYASFAPDVTGSQRALAVSLTDQGTGAVGARQRALRMYAGQDGDATMWGQEFTERLNVGNQTEAAGFSDSGFGFALGMDGGAPSSGRYGAAFTFYSGDTSEKEPRDSKTTSEWYMLTGYTDWRGKGLFLDSQLSVGYGSIDGKRIFDFGGVDRTAEGKRSAALLSGGFTTGVVLTAGGTVVTPQISVDGMTMREEGYTETNNGATTSQADDGFDLKVRQEYDSSLRTFAGLDIRQDLNFGDFFLQPDLRAGYRYDFLNAAQKLKAEFVCSIAGTANGGCGDTAFDITGPDPAKGNMVLGASIATTTGAWSIGLNYDYVRGIGNGGGNDSVTQSGTITLLGRI